MICRLIGATKGASLPNQTIKIMSVKPRIIKSVSELHAFRRSLTPNSRVGFVPTMVISLSNS